MRAKYPLGLKQGSNQGNPEEW